MNTRGCKRSADESIEEIVRSSKRRSSNRSSDVTAVRIYDFQTPTVEAYPFYADHQTGELEYQRRVNGFRDEEDDPFAPLHQPSPSFAIPGELESQPEANNFQPETMPDNPISADNQTTPSYTIITDGMESHPRDKPAMKGRGLVAKRLNFSDEVIKVSSDGKDGEYVLKLTTGDKKENAMEEQAQAAAMLLSQAAMLRGLGETLLSNLQAQFEPQFFKSLNMKEPTE